MALPRRKKGRCPILDIPWDGPYFVTRILGNVVYEIRMNRRSKSKIVHVDKLAPVRGEVDGEWVFKLPKKLKEYEVEHNLEGLSHLFYESIPLPVPAPMEQAVTTAVSTCEASTNPEVSWPVQQECEHLEIEASTIEHDLGVVKPVEIERDPSKKTTRSGKSYLIVDTEDECFESDSEFCARLFE